MVRGRKSKYTEPFVITLKCERDLHDTMMYLRFSDSDVYSRGASEIIKEKMGGMPVEMIHQFIQEKRRQMKDIQDDIALAERIELDATIRDQKKKKREIRFDERGKEYQVVIAE